MQDIDRPFSSKITTFSLFLAVSIVCYHLNPAFDFQTITNDGKWTEVISNYLNELLTSFGNLSLSFFFLSSSFLLYRNYTWHTFFEKLKRRVPSLFVPLVLWNILCLIYKMRFHDGFWETWSNILLSNYCGPLWFVVQLLAMFLLSPIFWWIFKNKWVGMVVLSFSFFMPQLVDSYIVRMLSLDESQLSVFSRTIQYLPLYFTGAYLALHGDLSVQQERYRTKTMVVLSSLLLVATLLPFENLFLQFIHPFQIFALWVIVPKKAFKLKLPWTHQISFFMYASHSIVIGITMRMLHKFVLNESIPVSIHTVLISRLFFTLLSIGIIYLIAWMLIRWLPKTYAILTGGRVPTY